MYLCSFYLKKQYLCSQNDKEMDEIKRIKQLRQELHEHNYRYYVLNQPTIGDQDFDFLMHELQDLEAKHPEMADQRPERGVRPGHPQIPHAVISQHL